MRVEQEWRNDEGHDREPEVDHVPSPDCQSSKEQDNDGSDTQVDGWSGESRVENAERDSRCRKASTRRNVSRTTEIQVAQDRMGVDLS